MTKYTSTSLIRELENFPDNTPIRTELAFIYNFDDECFKFQDKMREKDFLTFCKNNAVDMAIFEGSWEEDNISDLNNILPEYIPKWNNSKVILSKEEYDDLNFKLENTKNLLNDFMDMLNKLQANPSDEDLVSQARDMLLINGYYG